MELLEKDGNLCPVMFLENDKAKTITTVVLPDFDKDNKRGMLNALGRKLRDDGVRIDGMACCMEAWYTAYDTEVDIADVGMPSDSPNRKECIVSVYWNPIDDSLLCSMSTFTRDSDKIIWDKDALEIDDSGSVDPSILRSFWEGFYVN